MAFTAVKLLLEESQVARPFEQQRGDEVFAGELWVLDGQGAALRAAKDMIADAILFILELLKKADRLRIIGLLDLHNGESMRFGEEDKALHTAFVVHARFDAVLGESLGELVGHIRAVHGCEVDEFHNFRWLVILKYSQAACLMR